MIKALAVPVHSVRWLMHRGVHTVNTVPRAVLVPVDQAQQLQHVHHLLPEGLKAGLLGIQLLLDSFNLQNRGVHLLVVLGLTLAAPRLHDVAKGSSERLHPGVGPLFTPFFSQSPSGDVFIVLSL